MRPIALTACGYLDDHGCGSHNRAVSWPDIGQAATNIRWRMFSERPFDRFGRLDWLAKYAVVAVEMLGMPVDPPPESRRPTAVLLGTQYGSMSVDMRFHESIHRPGGASPMLFPYTLPSAAAGEIAIRFGLTGPSVCFIGGPQSGRAVFWESVDMLESGQVDACVCVSCDAVCAGETFLTGAESRDSGPIDGAAHAFLIETAQSARRNGRKALADVRVGADDSVTDTAAEAAPADDREMLGSLCAFLAGADAGPAGLRIHAPQALRTRQSIFLVRPSQANAANT